MTKLSAGALFCASLGGIAGIVIPFTLSGKVPAIAYIPFGVVLGVGIGALVGDLVFPVLDDD